MTSQTAIHRTDKPVSSPPTRHTNITKQCLLLPHTLTKHQVCQYDGTALRSELTLDLSIKR